MKVYSHRGESSYAPENTMSAFYLADLVNSDGIETDIRKTKDDVLVLIHDKTVDRTSNYSGKVSDYTYKELLKMDFGRDSYKGEKIVKLDDFLKYFSDKNKQIFLEIKEKGYEDDIVDLVNRYNNHDITIISFKYDVLEKIRKLSKTIKLGWLIYDVTSKIIEECKKIKLNDVLVTSAALNEKEVKLLHENGFNVVVWGVLNKNDIRRLYKMNVDKLIYNSGYIAKKVIKEISDE